MAKKKKDSAPEQSTEQTQQEPKQAAEKRPPQMVTANGDKITHAHVYKSNTSDDWFFTAKMNDLPLKPQKVSKEDLEAVLNKTIKPVELMEKYYPTKLQPKLPQEVFTKPVAIDTPDGTLTVHKFNAYKEKDTQSYDYGKYRFYAQIGDQKMSEPASKKDLDAYFDRTMAPKDLITKVFGERLHLKEYYQQFKLPEGVDESNVRIMKNKATSRYEISAQIPGAGSTQSKELSYNDRTSYFSHKTATKDQLAAKYLSNEVGMLLQNASRKQQKIEQPSLGL